MPIPTVTALPTPPSRGQAPAVFVSAADAFFGALPDLVAELNAFGPAVVEAAASYFTATSASNVTIGAGAKAFVIETGKAFQPGQYVIVANTADPAKNMIGQVTAHDALTGALTINVPAGWTSGAGTLASWYIGLTGARGTNGTNGTNGLDGAIGPQGPAGGTILTLISSQTPTAVASVTFSSIPATYENLYLDINGLSHDNGASQSLRMEISNDGATWSAPFIISRTAQAAAFVFRGGIFVAGRKRNGGALVGGTMETTTTPQIDGVNTTGWPGAFSCAGGINHVRLSFSAGDFDAGTVALYGG